MPLRIVVVFALISLVWISCSDTLINNLIPNTNLRLRTDIFVGLSYIVFMSVLLLLLLRRYVHKIQMYEQNYQILADSGQALIWTAGTDTLCNYFNKVWLDFTGRPLEQEIGNGWAEGVHPDDFQRCLDIYVGSFERREKFSMEYRLRRHDGEYRWLQDDGCPRYDTDGHFMGYIGYCLDIHDGKLMEGQLRQSQKMESIGTLAGGVAHDFNNILTVIMGACTMLQMKLEKDVELGPFVQQILSSSERAAKLTHNLLAFSRKQVIKPTSVDMNDVVGVMQDFLGRIIGEDIALETALTDDPLPVSVDRGQIEQVLMNLAVNARDAMPDGGVLRLETTRVDSRDHTLELEGCAPGSYALITVTDGGFGMNAATRTRIFEPFFTTKEIGYGTGLGLSMAYGIMKQHYGTIKVYSEPGEGTVFRVYLPLHGISPDEEPGLVQGGLVGGNENILLVEDDPDVRASNSAILESVGYNVLCASNGREAIDLFKEFGNGISIVVLDVIMPGMNGKEVHGFLRTIRSDVKVLFVSGYTADILSRKGVLTEGLHFLSKPLESRLFLGRVRELIDI
jgi:PAS domain S-box-containing protein